MAFKRSAVRFCSSRFFSSNSGELYDFEDPDCGLVRVCCFGSESLAESRDSVLTDALLHVEVMHSHIYIRMTDDALDSSEANALLFHKILGPLTHLLVNDPTGTCIIPIMQKYYSDTLAIVPIDGYNKFQGRSVCHVYDCERSC